MSSAPLRIIIQGHIPVRMLSTICEAFERKHPKAVVLDTGHSLCRAHRAALAIVCPDDPALGEREQDHEAAD